MQVQCAVVVLVMLVNLLGVKVQSEKFPVRFIIELLNRRHYVVLTGECDTLVLYVVYVSVLYIYNS